MKIGNATLSFGGRPIGQAVAIDLPASNDLQSDRKGKPKNLSLSITAELDSQSQESLKRLYDWHLVSVCYGLSRIEQPPKNKKGTLNRLHCGGREPQCFTTYENFWV